MRRHRAGVGVAAAGFTACGLLLAGVSAGAQSDCLSAFERWAKLSSARVVPQSGAARGACIPTDAVRSDLIEGLARVRGVCAAASDQSTQQTSDMLNANLSFIASLAVCPPAQGQLSASNDDGGEGWVAKSAPERPRVVAPAPAGPTVTGGPRPLAPVPPPAAPPRAAAAVPAPGGPASAVPAGPTPTPPCLEIARTPNDTFALVNHRCRG